MKFFNKRIAILLPLALICFISAAVAGEATDFMSGTAEKTVAILTDPEYQTTDKAKLKEQRDKLEVIAHEVFDFKLVTRLVAGRFWKKFSPEQQDELTQAFTDLLEATYLGRIRGYKEIRIEITDERPLKKGRVQVQTIVHADGEEVPIDYNLVKQDDWKVYDVIIEKGVGLVGNYREQFKEMLMNEDPQAVIAKVQEQAVKKRESEAEKVGEQ